MTLSITNHSHFDTPDVMSTVKNISAELHSGWVLVFSWQVVHEMYSDCFKCEFYLNPCGTFLAFSSFFQPVFSLTVAPSSSCRFIWLTCSLVPAWTVLKLIKAGCDMMLCLHITTTLMALEQGISPVLIGIQFYLWFGCFLSNHILHFYPSFFF